MKSRTLYEEKEKFDIINKCDVCRIAMADENGQPYIVCMNFAFDGKYLYLHSGHTGKKIDILLKNNRLCVEFSTDFQLYRQNEEVACSYGMKYRSVLLHGTVEFIEDVAEKVRMMNLIMQKYTGKSFTYNPPAINSVAIMRVVPSLIEGKVKGY